MLNENQQTDRHLTYKRDAIRSNKRNSRTIREIFTPVVVDRTQHVIMDRETNFYRVTTCINLLLTFVIALVAMWLGYGYHIADSSRVDTKALFEVQAWCADNAGRLRLLLSSARSIEEKLGALGDVRNLARSCAQVGQPLPGLAYLQGQLTRLSMDQNPAVAESARQSKEVVRYSTSEAQAQATRLSERDSSMGGSSVYVSALEPHRGPEPLTTIPTLKQPSAGNGERADPSIRLCRTVIVAPMPGSGMEAPISQLWCRTGDGGYAPEAG